MKKKIIILMIVILIPTGSCLGAVNLSVGSFFNLANPVYPKDIVEYFSLDPSGGIEGMVMLSQRTAFTFKFFYQHLYFAANSGDNWLWDHYSLFPGCTFGSGDAFWIAMEINLKRSYSVFGNLKLYWLCGAGLYLQKYQPVALSTRNVHDARELRIREDELSPAAQAGAGLEYTIFKRFIPFIEFERQYIFTNLYPTSLNTLQAGLRVVVFAP